MGYNLKELEKDINKRNARIRELKAKLSNLDCCRIFEESGRRRQKEYPFLFENSGSRCHYCGKEVYVCMVCSNGENIPLCDSNECLAKFIEEKNRQFFIAVPKKVGKA